MKVNMDALIQTKCIEAYNSFKEETGCQPTKLYLGSSQYTSLWFNTFCTWTRELNKPHNLTHYLDCEIVIVFGNEIYCGN